MGWVAPSPRPSPLVCANFPSMRTLSGLSGVAETQDATTPLLANPQRFSCTAGLRQSRLGRQNVTVFALDLGSDTRLGGALTVSTGGQSRGDTVLFVGTGCPDSNAALGCVAANDDSRLLKSAQSRVAIVATARVYFVVVGGWGGTAIRSGLRWAYTPPGTGSGALTALTALTAPAAW